MWTTVALASIAVTMAVTSVSAADLTLLCSNGLRAVMLELVAQFERASRHKVSVKYDLAAGLKREIDAGAPFDFVVLTPALLDDLVKSGAVVGSTKTVIARSPLGIAIRSGSRKPDLATIEAFTRTLTDARSIAYAREGAAGVYFADLIQRLKIADALEPKSRKAANGVEVSQAVASGQVELGVMPVSEILPAPGIELAGTFPAGVEGYAVMVGAIGARARENGAARELLTFLMSPAALPVIRQKGMERVAK